MHQVLNDEHRALQQLARDFTEKEIIPVAAERDRIQDPKETFSPELIKNGSPLGLRSLQIPILCQQAHATLLMIRPKPPVGSARHCDGPPARA